MNIPIKIVGITLAFALISFLFFDQPVSYFFHGLSDPALLSVSTGISFLGESKFWLVVSACCLLFALYQDWKHSVLGRAKAWYYFSLSNFMAIMIGTALKYTLGRYRPTLLFEQHLYGFQFFASADEMHSFPSGHAVIIFSVMVCLSRSFPRYKIACYSLAILVCLSRVVLLRHYPSDVLVGACIGFLSATAAYCLIFGRAQLQKLR